MEEKPWGAALPRCGSQSPVKSSLLVPQHNLQPHQLLSQFPTPACSTFVSTLLYHTQRISSIKKHFNSHLKLLFKTERSPKALINVYPPQTAHSCSPICLPPAWYHPYLFIFSQKSEKKKKAEFKVWGYVWEEGKSLVGSEVGTCLHSAATLPVNQRAVSKASSVLDGYLHQFIK